jgi:RNA polymerase sigma-70 factor (ECF subfamily)
VTIARSRACDAVRRRRSEGEGVAAKDGIDRSDPASLIEQGESCRIIMRALERLPADQLSAIQSAFYGGMTHIEIARQQQIPLGTVKTRIRSGIRRLRDMLSDQEQEKAKRL